jgi:hypothetical protein
VKTLDKLRQLAAKVRRWRPGAVHTPPEWVDGRPYCGSCGLALDTPDVPRVCKPTTMTRCTGFE